MADNTKDYNVNINYKVNGKKDLQDMGDESEKAAGKAKSLKAQIREVTQEIQKLEQSGKGSGKELKALRDKLDDLNDAADRAKFKSGQFEDKLASLPGPLGKVGGGLKTVGDSFATFGKTLTISLGVIGLLVAAFLGIKEALGKTKEGTQALAAVTSALNKVMAPLFAILEKVGTAILPIVTKGFEALGTVMSKVAKFFGVSDAKITEVTASLEENNEAANKLAEAEKERVKKAEEAAAKAEEARKKRFADRIAMMQAIDKLDEAELAKQKANALATADTEQEKLDIEREFAKKSYELKKKDILDLRANYKEGTKEYIDYTTQLKTLEGNYTTETAGFRQKQRDLDKEATKKRYDDDIKALELKNAQGLLTESEYQKALYDTAVKYGQDVQNALIKYEQYKTELKKKNAEEARTLLISELQDQINAIDAANAKIEGDYQQDQERLLQKKELLKAQRDEELKAVENDAVKRNEIIKKYAKEEQDVDKALTESKKAEYQARIVAQNEFLGAVAGVFGQLSSLFGQGTAASKAAALAEIAIQTGVGFANGLRIAQESSKATGPAAAFAFPIFYATQIAAVLAAVGKAKSILSQVTPGSSSTNVSTTGGGAPSTPPPTFNSKSSIPQVQFGALGVGTSSGTQIAQSLGLATNKPVQAYVVSQQISSQQAFDRRTNVAATMN